MMHNSMVIRETLREANNNVLHRSRRDPHRGIRPIVSTAATVPDNERSLTGEWSIRMTNAIPGMEEAAADVSDFLKKLGVSVISSGTDQLIEFSIDPQIAEGSFRQVVDDSGISIQARDMKGIWAGLVHLEKGLVLKSFPSVPMGQLEKAPSWKVQISQTTFGSNYLVPDLSEPFLSDDAFRMLAHYGINGMTIYGDWLCYVKSDLFPELNSPDYDQNIATLQDAAARAKKYGVQLYYVPVSPKLIYDHPLFERLPSVKGAKIATGLSKNAKKIHNLCSTDPLSQRFQGEVMANLFKEVPDLGGIILIIGGESFYHCYMRPDLHGLPPGQGTNCKLCAEKRAEEVVNSLLKATSDAVHAVKPNAPVMAWPYSAFRWSNDPAQLELIEHVQEDVSLLTTIDKDQWVQKDGYQKLIWDYSVDYTGPADNTLIQSKIIKRREMDLFLKTETSLGLESIHVPYVPSIQRLGEKWRQVSSLKPSGVLQSWMFFGMWGSRAEELGWWTSWYPEKSMDEIIQIIADRDFGELGSQMIHVWQNMSDAVGHFPYIPDYFTGPEFIGPAHPIFFGDEGRLYEEFEASLYYLQENEETFSTTVHEVKHSLIMHQLPEEMFKEGMKLDHEGEFIDMVIKERKKVVDYSMAAYKILKRLSSDDMFIKESLKEELLLCEFLTRTFISTENTYSFLWAKKNLKATTGKDYNDEMIRIARNELDNAKCSRKIYVEAPWLDVALRVDGKYPSSLAMLDRKIAILEESLEKRQGV